MRSDGWRISRNEVKVGSIGFHTNIEELKDVHFLAVFLQLMQFYGDLEVPLARIILTLLLIRVKCFGFSREFSSAGGNKR